MVAQIGGVTVPTWAYDTTPLPALIRLCARYENNKVVSIFVENGEFPSLTWITREVIADADPRFLTRDGDVLSLVTENGTARYRIAEGEDDLISHCHTIELIGAEGVSNA